MQNRKIINQINNILFKEMIAYCTEPDGVCCEGTACMIRPYIHFNDAIEEENQFINSQDEINWEQVMQLLLIRLEKYIEAGSAGQKAHNSFKLNPVQPKAEEPPSDRICIEVIKRFIGFVAMNYKETLSTQKETVINELVPQKIISMNFQEDVGRAA